MAINPTSLLSRRFSAIVFSCCYCQSVARGSHSRFFLWLDYYCGVGRSVMLDQQQQQQ